MAQTGFTPISLYYSSTTTNVPLAANLASGELAINTADGKLFYKDNVGAVQIIGYKNVPASTVIGTFTSLTDSGNLNFTGTGNRITGDFSNATVASRVMFQTSTVNSFTTIDAIPSGTGTLSQWTAFAQSDPNNSSLVFMRATASTDVRFSSGITGTGTYLPMTFYTGGSERVRVDTSGNVGIGTASPTVNFDLSKTNAGAGVSAYITNTSSATNSQAEVRVTQGAVATVLNSYNNSNAFIGTISNHPVAILTNNTERMRIDASGNVGIGKTPSYRLQAYVDNGATAGPVYVSVLESTSSAPGTTSGPALGFIYGTRPIASIETQRTNPGGGYGGDLVFKTNDPSNATATFAALTERLRITSTGDVTVSTAALLGYGTGSGGTVTQATSKSTGVTLNKPTGQITMNNEALAAGATVNFAVANSLITAQDTIIANIQSSIAGPGIYRLQATDISAGLFRLSLTNTSGTNLSNAVVLNFAVIKGSTS